MGGRGGSGPSKAATQPTEGLTRLPDGTLVLPPELTRTLALGEIARRVSEAPNIERARELVSLAGPKKENYVDMARLAGIRVTSSQSVAEIKATLVRNLYSARKGHERLQGLVE
jgi:hypothetical protein